MMTYLGNMNCLGIYFIHEAMFVAHPPRPVTGEIVLERFGFANAFERGTLHVFYESIDPFEDVFIRALPVEIVFPGVPGENERHSSSSRSVPRPCSNSAIDSSSRLAFFGLRKR